ncbi:hypothetical protein [Bacillus sp. OTU530]|uniref:hypothetical protein n=1 Tax=Bacillus sp. OTU530 TaxID=3043862 RepID=UPI00313E7992
MTIVGESIVVWTVTGISVISMKIAEQKGFTIPHWLPRMTMYTTLTGSFIFLLRYVLFAFL